MKASWKVSPKHATSPVDTISTPVIGSALSSRVNENCGAFTPKPVDFPSPGLIVPPIIAMAARSIRFVPIIFETNGILLDALRLHSIT